VALKTLPCPGAREKHILINSSRSRDTNVAYIPSPCFSLGAVQVRRAIKASVVYLVFVFSATNPPLILYRRLTLRGSMTAKLLLLLQLVAVLQLSSIAFAWSSECPGKVNTCNMALSTTAFSKSKESLDACLMACSLAYGDWLWPDNGYPWAAMDCVAAQSGILCPFNPAERTTFDCASVIGVCTGTPVDISQFQGKEPDAQVLLQQTNCLTLQSICTTCLAVPSGTQDVCRPVCSLRC
jgi:hypothetical protein